jgi:hypothetical protein
MFISDANRRRSAPGMSPFPKVIRPFTEPVTATQDKVIGPGRTLPDLIRTYYPGATPLALEANFSFLDRHNKDRDYDPRKEDPFVFSGISSISDFHKEARALLGHCTDLWRNMGLPVTLDKDRKVEGPDSEAINQIFYNEKHELHKFVVANIKAISCILSNYDIGKKFCIVRTVSVGWWCVSYKGKRSSDTAYFQASLEAHKQAFVRLMASGAIRSKERELWNNAGDPIFTNPGYPFFSASVDKDQQPVDRIRTIELFRGMNVAGMSKWDDLLSLVDRRAGKYGMAGFPLCVAPLSRLQPGYKWNHQMQVTPSGMVTAFDERGINSMRVAWMVPYVYNLFLTPFQVRLKAFRMCLPGLYHDGPAKTLRVKGQIKWSAENRFFVAEADYSNYDRFIPVDIIEDITSFIANSTDKSNYWTDAAMFLHRDASLVWPDYTSISSGNGWLFKPGELGLMSGVKVTSETGTLVNSVVNLQALMNAEGWSVAQAVDYLTMYENSAVGSKYERFYIQSDDSQLIAPTPKQLAGQMKAFNEAALKAGLKGEVSLADRFLMREMQDGRDAPVAYRVWQNTLSNESPPANQLVFMAGLCARTDGLFGIKTVDPFQTGKRQQMTGAELVLTYEVVASLKRFIASSAAPYAPAVKFLDTLLAVVKPDVLNKAREKPNMTVKLSTPLSVTLDSMRYEATKALAEYELAKALAKGGPSLESWLYELYRDKHVPSQSLILEQLKATDSRIADLEHTFEGKEHSFFLYAIEALGIKPLD